MAEDHSKEMLTLANPERFMSICPRNVSYLESNTRPISLRVIQKSGVKVEPDIKFNEITLSGNNKIFTNQSGDQDSFTVKVLLHKDDRVQLYRVLYSNIVLGKNLEIVEHSDPHFLPEKTANLIEALDYWIRSAEPFYVVTKAVDIPKDKLWLITKNKSRTQEYTDGYVEWELTFTRYKNIKLGYFKTKSSGVASAIKAYNKSSTKSKATSTTTLIKKLVKCDRKVLVYSKKKKVLNCVKVMQEILYNEGCFDKKMKKSEAIDGWYGKDTKNAVKKYQKKYKKYNLPQTGNVNFRTYQLMCGVVPKVKVTAVNDLETKAKNATSKSGVVNVNVTKNVVNSPLAGKQQLATVSVKSTSLVSQKSGSKTTKVTLKEATPVKKTTTTVKKNGAKVTKSPNKSTKVTSKSKTTTKNKNKTSKK